MNTWKCAVSFALLTLTASNASAQSPSAAAAAPQSKVVDSLNTAMASGQFIDTGKEYDLNKTVDLTSTSAAAATGSGATAGASGTSPKTGSEVEFQVGTKDGKPAFVTVRVPDDQREKVDQAINGAISTGQIKPSGPSVQACAPGYTPKCVQTGKDGKCTRYECSPPQ